ncbi:hypothetical protein [Archangium sp.]|uniref:DUF7151 family protein n=1 Tax=Archangium sp. TaxID=1872627 RepID=UPI00389A7F7C
MTSAEQPGSNCAAGGMRLVVGTDANRNGALDDAEIDPALTRFICNGTKGADGATGANGVNGANGADGLSTLVTTTPEPVGTHCPAGGTRVQVGPDANRNGTLDTTEVVDSFTQYVCHGAKGLDGAAGANGTNGTNGKDGTNGTNGKDGINGTNGTNGVDGLTTLVVTTAESVGSTNCPAGGTRMQVGRDANRNGTLDTAEMDASLTRYVCNGSPGAKGDKGDPGVMYVRTRVVNPGATDLDSGNALRAAIAGITDGKTWRVKLEPGVYDLGTSALVLKPGIQLEGSGETSTFLRASVDSTSQGTVVGAAGAGLSSLSVENTGGGANVFAIYSTAADFGLHDVTAIARNGATRSWAIVLFNSTGTFQHVRALGYSSGASDGYPSGFRCYTCTANLLESYAEANGDTSSANTQTVGLYTSGGTVYLRNVTSKGSGASTNWGVYAQGDAVLVNVEAIASGGSDNSGLTVQDGSVNVRNSTLSASSGTATNEGLGSFNSGTTPRTITVQNTVISGGSTGVFRAKYFDLRLAQTQVSGPLLQTSVAGAGKYTCVGLYDGGFAPIVSCP